MDPGGGDSDPTVEKKILSGSKKPYPDEKSRKKSINVHCLIITLVDRCRFLRDFGSWGVRKKPDTTCRQAPDPDP